MDGMIMVFQGSRGSGKTMSMLCQALEFQSLGWKIISNFKNPFSEYVNDEYILQLDKNSDLRDCVILIDELQIFFDSRDWKKNQSKGFSNFVQQIRKRNIVLLGTTQYVDTVEKRIRQHIDYLAKPYYYEYNQVCTCTVIDLTSLEDSPKLLSYKYYYYAPPLFDLYNTNELI